MATGSRVIRAGSLPVDLTAVDDAQVVDGVPRAGSREVAEIGDLVVGIWEHTVGVSRDVEVDEVFVVLAGEATIEIEGADNLDVAPGDVCVLTAGSRTIWHVRSPLRKVFIGAA